MQFPNGGVARYHRADVGLNQNISTEITGYAVSALAFAHRVTGEDEFLDSANRAATFLVRHAWDAQTGAMPFEIEPAALSYFFDDGIVVRGLLALWRIARAGELLETAAGVACSMANDFAREDGASWPVLSLPEKKPLETDANRWSRTPGCYQLKSAVAWRELAEVTGDPIWRGRYSAALQQALASHESFLPGHPDPHKVMDRLHAYLYFLEALLAHPEHSAIVSDGVRRVRDYRQQIAPRFDRADVAAQLLRVQLCAGVEESEIAQTAADVREFQRSDGGYYFGRAAGQWIPHVSPVPTAFAMQALEWYERRESIDRAAVI